MKQNSHKNSPRYTIAKLLMNSLYGKFGMNPEMDQHIIVLGKDIPDLFKKWIIVDQMSLSSDKFLVTIRNKNEDNDSDNSHLNISVSISAMITAASRIKMIDYLNIIKDNDAKIFYTDTDSIYTNKPLSDDYVNNQLGFMKLEGIFDKGIFLAPKVYGLFNSVSKGQEEIVKVKGLILIRRGQEE